MILNYAKPKQSKPLPVDEIQLLTTFIHAHYRPMCSFLFILFPFTNIIINILLFKM